MHAKERLSDQYYDWSDTSYRKSPAARPATRDKAVGETVASLGGSLAGFADRALQALLQTGMQVRSRTGAWAEVLPFDQPGGSAAADGLRALRVPATGAAVCKELSAGSRNTETDLRGKPRVAATTETTVERLGECHGNNDAGELVPTGYGHRSGRQHAPELFLASRTQAAGGADR